MDLSGIIFVVLAVAWAVYLIPKALKHHDEMARTRSVDRFSSTVRVLARRSAPAPSDSPAPVLEAAPPVRTITRAKARAAAARRRRVLGVLTVLLVVVAGLGHLGRLPWLATAVPAVLIVAFLVVARLTVRAQSRTTGVRPEAAPSAFSASSASWLVEPIAREEHDVDADLDTEDTMGLSRAAVAAAVAEPADEGSLWDPLPVTLPTYVTKARARRTVRTIELTQTGLTSSGHSEADTELVRQAEALKAEAAAEAARIEAASEAGQRKAAGA